MRHGKERAVGKGEWKEGVLDLIGDTPLIHLRTVSEACGARILAKCEFLAPGYSVKDRIARHILERAEAAGKLRPGKIIVEATAGNTGIGLAMVAAAKGYRTALFLSDDVSSEKIDLLRAMGAEVHVSPKTTWDDPNHYYQEATRYVESLGEEAYFVDQFTNLWNVEAHYETTGPEIWRQTAGEVDYLVTGMGTAGTVVGTGRYLKERKPEVRIIGVDPSGSVYHRYFHEGLQEAEGVTYMEGVGIGQIPGCYDREALDDTIHVDDGAAICMIWHLAGKEGLFVGGSSGLSVAGAYRIAREEGGGKTFVCFLCDTGARYLSKLFNPGWLEEHGFWEASQGSLEEHC
jgi:cysteine synthase A